MDKDIQYEQEAHRVIDVEIAELQRLRDRAGSDVVAAVRLLEKSVSNGGKVVVVGVGKSGSVGRKLVATLSSTGSPAVVLNAQDALHGDIGVVSDNDVIIALSYSGETKELLDVLPHFRRAGVSVVGITGGMESTLARHSAVVLDASVEREACPLNLAPTSSTTVMQVLGDAVAMVLLKARGFGREDFARLHPGGSIGQALLTLVSDIMREGDGFSLVNVGATVGEAVASMGQARCGATAVSGEDGKLAGVFTHGDFARAFASRESIRELPVADFMTVDPVTIRSECLATEVIALLREHRIDDIIVLDEQGVAIGLVDSQDLSRLRLI